jgi:hypothetical protein
MAGIHSFSWLAEALFQPHFTAPTLCQTKFSPTFGPWGVLSGQPRGPIFYRLTDFDFLLGFRYGTYAPCAELKRASSDAGMNRR